jgi:uncharacterized membrane protein
VLDLDAGAVKAAERLFINDIGECTLRLDRPIAADRYAESKETGSFILIDPESYDTVGMGFVEGSRAREGLLARLRRRLTAPRHTSAKTTSDRSRDSHFRSIAKAVSWRTTGSIDTFLVTFIITGSKVFASSVAVTEILTKIVFYYGHERVWALIPWGRE